MCFTLLLSGKKTFEYLWLDFYRMLFFSSLEVAKQSFLWLWLRLVESQVINRILLILHILKSTVFLLSKEKKKSCMFKCGNAGDNDASDIRLLFVFAVVAFFFFLHWLWFENSHAEYKTGLIEKATSFFQHLYSLLLNISM